MTSNRLCILLIAALALPLPASAFSLFWWDSPPEKSDSDKRHASAPALRSTPSRVDRILVKKAERRLYLMRGDKPFKTYRIALGYQPKGHKRYQGDGRTPEGRYYLDWRSLNSKYYKAMHISYPSGRDLIRARSSGRDPGGAIMIHGQPSLRSGERRGDWTFGCIAVSNLAIDEIWSYVEVGTPIEILP
jgi:murein L,D-transpeptidase YafK